MKTVLRLASVKIEVVSVDHHEIRFRYSTGSRNTNIYRVPLKDILNLQDIEGFLSPEKTLMIVLGENHAINHNISSIVFSRTIVLPDETKFF